jgi:DNA-binding transcriptional LysR family regulator
VVPILPKPPVASFCQSYPEVELEVAASEELAGLAAERFDAGIRLVPLYLAKLKFRLVRYLGPSGCTQKSSPRPVSTHQCWCRKR